MHPLHKAIGLGVVSRRLHMVNVELGAEGSPEGERELKPPSEVISKGMPNLLTLE
jgi:hypothetical protein